MAVLPTAMVTIEIPDVFRPSQLPYSDQCALRALSVNHGIVRLPSGPQAARGRLAHEFLDSVMRESRADEQLDGLKKELFRQVARMEEELRRDAATAAFARLEETLPPLEWRNFLHRVVESATRLLKAASVGGTHGDRDEPSSDRLSLDTLPTDGVWTEFPVSSALLRLSGRIDALEMRSGDHVTIRDYKTGAAVDNHGQVREEVAKQLRLYGLIVLERLAKAHIDLIVDDGTEHVVSFGADDIAHTRTWLRGVLARLPARASVAALALADPGPTCGGCGIRHVCPAYRRAAPDLWREGSALAAMPMDVWGTVRTLLTRGDGTVTIELEDAAGRMVKIFRLDRRHDVLRTVQSGDGLWFFGLSGWSAQGPDKRWKHPRNFWEIPGDATQRRAW